MVKIESPIRQIAYSQELVFNKLSDFSNIGRIVNHVPADQVKDLTFDVDSVSFSVPPVGSVSLRIIDRDPFKCIKIKTDKSPIAMTAWIQIVSTGADSCKIKITVEVDVNIFMAKMVEKPLKEGLVKVVDMLASINYD